MILVIFYSLYIQYQYSDYIYLLSCRRFLTCRWTSFHCSDFLDDTFLDALCIPLVSSNHVFDVLSEAFPQGSTKSLLHDCCPWGEQLWPFFFLHFLEEAHGSRTFCAHFELILGFPNVHVFPHLQSAYSAASKLISANHRPFIWRKSCQSHGHDHVVFHQTAHHASCCCWAQD